MLALDSTRKRTPGFDGKRLHLLKSAARVFSEIGYGRASMRLIAAETDLSLAGIYHYVASKEELLYWIQYHTFDSLLKGLGKLQLDRDALAADLEVAWEVLAEPVQTVMRRYGLENPYEQLKQLTRGRTIDRETLREFIGALEIPQAARQHLLDMTPSSYTGNAEDMALELEQFLDKSP